MVQGIVATSADAAADLESYLAEFASHPLLTAAQERDADLRKWAAVRSCQRMLVSHDLGRALMLQFCDYCLQSPPTPTTPMPRSVYFQLRKDVASFLPGKADAVQVVKLHQQLQQGACATDIMTGLRRSAWPATLVIGLAAVALRHLGVACRDTSADALQAWITPWRNPRGANDQALAINLRYAVQRYLASRDKLVLHNIRLVYKLASENRLRDVPFGDLVQDGCAGLVRAAEKFDYRLGYRFSTYAYNWISQGVQRSCQGSGSLIGYPTQIHQEINYLHRVRMDYLQESGIDPGLTELARLASLPIAKVQKLRSLNNITVSLDQPLGPTSELNWSDTLADQGAPETSCQAENMLLSKLVHGSLDSLEELERRIVCGRFGLQGREPLTYRELALQLDISTEWARQLEKSALGKMRDDGGLAEACRA